MRISFLFFLFFSVNLFAENRVDATEGSHDSLGAEEQALVQELSVRDSVMAVHDSAAKATEFALRTELQNEKNQCKNWEQSWTTVQEENRKCTKALRVAIESHVDGTAKQEESARYMTVSSFLAGLVLGVLGGWFFL